MNTLPRKPAIEPAKKPVLRFDPPHNTPPRPVGPQGRS